MYLFQIEYLHVFDLHASKAKDFVIEYSLTMFSFKKSNFFNKNESFFFSLINFYFFRHA